jgi:hypothetical protein
VVDLDEELAPHGAEEPFDLAASGRLARLGVDQADAQHRTGALQRCRHERRTLVDIDRGGGPA